MKKLFLLPLLLVLVALAAFLPARAQQDSEGEDRSYLVGLLEDQLSTPNRQIRISGIEGALSSNATIGSITIADREGVWLKITDARIVWTRSALLLGRLSIDTLAADSIEVSRQPLPDDSVVPSAESTAFQLPELPVSITLDKLDVPRVAFGPTVFGLESVLAVTGRISLDDGALDSALEIKRLDGPGGQLTLAAAYANETQNLNLDLKLSEPENGVVANLLNIEGTPPVALALQGSGPLSGLNLDLALDTDGVRTLSGTAQVRQGADGYGFTTALNGDVARLVAAPYRAFFGPQTKLTAEGLAKSGGGFLLKSLALDGAALDVNASAETAPDGFLRRLGIYAYLGTRDDRVTVLPVPGGQTTVDRAELRLSFGETTAAEWTGSLTARKLSTASLAAENVDITMGGQAENLDTPAQRSITFKVGGGLRGIIPTRADVAEALGDRLDLDIEGDWRAGQPLRLARAALTGNGLAASLAGRVADAVFTGNISVDAASLAPFSGLAGRDLAGRLRLDADGSVAPISGSFDLALDGSATGLRLGSEALDGLLGGETRITGRVARTPEGFRAERLSLANAQVTVNADGTFASGAADFNFDAGLSDLALVTPRASGRVAAQGRAKGQDGVIGITLKADVPQGTLAGKPLAAATLAFDGTLKGSDIDGRVTGEARLDNVPVTLATTLAATETERRLSDLALNAGPTAITGAVAQEVASGLLNGSLKLASPDVSTLAALALVEASGAANAEIGLSGVEGKQNATVSASATNLVAEGVRVGSLQLQATIADLFGVPVVDGTASGADIVAGGVSVKTLQAQARATGTRTDFAADASLANAATVSTTGALEPAEGGGFRLTLERAELAQGSLRARLAEPGLLTVQGANVAIDNLLLDVGGGRVRAGGKLADTYDLSVGIEALPLAIANAIKPDLALGGTVAGTAKISGSRAQPNVDFDLQARDVAAAVLRRAGLNTVSADATGRTDGGRLALDAAVTSPEGLDARAKGEVPLAGGALALDVNLARFPLAILNAVVPDQALTGRLAGTAHLSGTLEAPAASFDVTGTGIGAAPLTLAGLKDLSLAAKGEASAERVTVDARVSSPQGLNATAKGTVPLDGKEIALDVALGNFPLAVLNAAVPGQDLAGTVSGTAKISGTLDQPAADFDIRGERLGAAPLSRAGLSNLALQARGRTEGRAIDLDANLTSPQGLKLTARGAVPLDNGQLGIDVVLDAFPLATLNAAVPGQDLAGTVSGRARVTGALANPAAEFRLDGSGISAAPLASAGAAPLTLSVAGRYAGRVLTIGSADVSGPGGIVVSAAGRLPVSGTGADLRVNGSFPLSLANRFLAERGAQASGTLSVDIRVAGSLSQPVVTGSFTTSGGTLVDPESNLRVSAINLSGTLDGQRVVLSNASATVGGGRVTASGSIGITGDLPSDIRVSLDNVRYADGNLVVATVSAALNLSGSLLRDPLLAGTVDVARAEISVPERLGGSAAQLNVRHRNAPPGVQATLKRAKADDGTPVPTARPSVLRLNVTVNAPARIFVRGRGLDAELGGSVKLTGSVSDIQPVGGFRLIRGRLGILGQRITFDEGEVTLVGDLDPFIDFTARSEGEGITVFVNVRGRVSDLQITFSSEPALPQDEVLARLIFNRSIDELSAFQIAQLAAAAAELAGGSNNSLMGSLRKATGLDDLDVVTDSQGNAAVRAGRYVRDNVYLGLEAGAGGSTKATINLDLTDNLKAKGSVGVEDSGLGVFYERDY